MTTKEISLVKKLMFQDLERELGSRPTAFFSRFDRLSVQDMGELRRSLEKVSHRTLVVKHSLVRKVMEKAEFGDATCFLEGSVLMTLGTEEPERASKALASFEKGHQGFELKGAIFEGKVYDKSFVKQLATLPSRQELLGIVTIRTKSPITGLVMALSGLMQSFVRVLDAIHKQKQGTPEEA